MIKNFLGKDGFIWWIGVVEDRHDPLYLGRCKVRIHGWHTANKIDMPTESLPWSYPLMPITSGSMTGVGISPTGPVEGTWVMGFYRDGETGQHPVMLGTFHGIPEEDVRSIYTKELGFYDPRMYDGTPEPEHALDFFAKKKVSRIRSLVYYPDDEKINVPREPYFITPTIKEGEKNKPSGSGVLVFEYPVRDPYPDYRYIGEPTTPRSARGKGDPNSQLDFQPNGSSSGSGPHFLKEDIRLKYFSNISVPHEYTQPVKTKGTITIGGFTTSNVEPAKAVSEWSEYRGKFNPRYPYNHVQQTESGHLIEYDDTPGAERLHWYHRSGTFTEIFAGGDRVDRIHGTHTRTIFSSDFMKTYGDKFQNVSKSYGISVNENQEPQNNFSVTVGQNSSMFVKVKRGNIYFENDSDLAEDVTTGTKSSGITQFDTDQFIVNARSRIVFNSEEVNFSGDYLRKIVMSPTSDINVNTDSSYSISSSGLKLQSSSMFESSFQSVKKTVNHQDWELIVNSEISGPVPGSSTIPIGQIGKRTTVGIGDAMIEALGGTSGVLGNVFLTAGAGISNQVVETPLSITPTTNPLVRNDGVRQYTSGRALYQFAKSYVALFGEGKLEAEALIMLLGRGVPTEPVIKGAGFMQEFLLHTHATGTGPSGPVQDARPYFNTLSKKVFLNI